MHGKAEFNFITTRTIVVEVQTGGSYKSRIKRMKVWIVLLQLPYFLPENANIKNILAIKSDIRNQCSQKKVQTSFAKNLTKKFSHKSQNLVVDRFSFLCRVCAKIRQLGDPDAAT